MKKSYKTQEELADLLRRCNQGFEEQKEIIKTLKAKLKERDSLLSDCNKGFREQKEIIEGYKKTLKEKERKISNLERKCKESEDHMRKIAILKYQNKKLSEKN